MFFLILLGHAFGYLMIAGSEAVTVPDWIHQLGIFALWLPLLLIPFFRSRPGALLLFLLGSTAIGFETLSIYTGFPYSTFEYGNNFGYKLFNVTPWTVFFGWTPLVIATTSLAMRITKKYTAIILISALLLVIFDLVFDPIATAETFWIWDSTGLYYGVPFQNFIGWFITGLIGTAIAHKLLQPIESDIHIFLFLFSTSFWTGASIASGFYIPIGIGWSLLLLTFSVTKKLPATIHRQHI